MASEAVASSATEGLTPAQKLMQEHDHHVTVEDVPDEEDLVHPAPSTTTKSASDAPLSEKAAGKQKAADTPAPKKPALNTSSEEAFPALGPVKPRAQAVAPTWGKKPAAVTSTNTNGDASSNDAALPIGRGPALPSMNIPGKHTERISFSRSLSMKPSATSTSAPRPSSSTSLDPVEPSSSSPPVRSRLSGRLSRRLPTRSAQRYVVHFLQDSANANSSSNLSTFPSLPLSAPTSSVVKEPRSRRSASALVPASRSPKLSLVRRRILLSMFTSRAML
jgi:hypothetical protein